MQVGKVEIKEEMQIKSIWTIQVIDLFICNVGEYFELASFSTFHNEAKIKWNLRIYPKGDSTGNKEYIFVNLVAKCDLRIAANINFCDGPICYLKNNETGVQKLFPRKNLFNEGYILQKDACFNLKSTIYIINMKPEAKEITNGLNILRSREHVSFENLLDCEKFSDVIFSIGGKKIYGHKNLLSSRSQTFSSMFLNDETLGDVVCIDDIEFDVFREMLRYLYAAKVNDIDKFAIQLLYVADKYIIKGLKYLCEEILCENLTMDNALTYYEVAERSNAVKLQNQTIYFMKINAKDIIYRPDFKSSNAMFAMLKMLLGIRTSEAEDVLEIEVK